MRGSGRKERERREEKNKERKAKKPLSVRPWVL